MPRVVIGCAVAVPVAAGVVAMAAGFVMEYGPIAEFIQAHSYSGDPAFLSPDYVARVVVRARLLGILWLLAGLVLWWKRKAFVETISSWHHDRLHTGIRRDPILYGIAALYLGLAGYFLNQPMHPDEARTVNAYALRPFAVAWADTTAPNNHVLHTLAVKASVSVFGLNEPASRVPAYLAGLGVILGGYLLALQLYERRRYARVYAALLATGGPLILFGSTGRGYSLMVACMLFLFWSVSGLLRDGRSARLWFVCGVSVLVGMATLPLMLMPVLAAFSLILWSSLKRRDEQGRALLKGALLVCVPAGLAVLLFYTPALVMVERAMLTDRPTVVPFAEWPSALSGSLAATGAFFAYGSYGLVRLALIAFFIVFVLTQWKCPAFLLVVWTLVWTLLPLALFRYVPYERTLIHVYALWLLGAVGGVQAVSTRWHRHPGVGRVLMGILSLAAVVNAYGLVDRSESGTLMPDYFLSDAPAIVEALKEDLREDDIIVCRSPSASSLIFYVNKHGLKHRVYDVREFRPRVNARDAGRRLIVVRIDYQRLEVEQAVVSEDQDLAFLLEDTVEYPRSTVKIYRIQAKRP